MENRVYTIKEKEKAVESEKKPRNKRFLTIVIIVQAIIIVIQLVIYGVYKNEQSLYDKELIQIVNNIHHNQQIIQKDIENYDSYKNIQYLLKQEDGLEYNVIVQSYNDQDNAVDIMDGYLDAYIKRGNGRQEIENIVKGSDDEATSKGINNKGLYKYMCENDELIGIEVYDKELFNILCERIYDNFKGTIQQENDISDIDNEFDTQVKSSYGINCNFIIQYVDKDKEGFGSTEIKQLLDLNREYNN